MNHFHLIKLCLPVLAIIFPIKTSLSGEAFSNGFQAGHLENRLLIDAQDGRLHRFPLWEAALIASGEINEKELQDYRIQFDKWSDRLQKKCRSISSVKETSQVVFRFLHEEILTGQYDKNSSHLKVIFECGNYNCLSATILYNSLAAKVGLPIEAVERPGHVFSRLHEYPTWKIETTCPDWFSVHGPSLLKKRLKKTNSHETSVIPINSVQLLSRVYYNRGVELLHQRRFAAAISVSKMSLMLDQNHKMSKDNLLAGMNNWALALCDRGDYEQAVELLSEIRKLQPNYQPLADNELHIRQKWVVHLCDQREYEQAVNVLWQGNFLSSESTLYEKGRLYVYHRLFSDFPRFGDIES